MGVDVMMFAVLPKGKHKTEEECKELSYRLASLELETFHSEHFDGRCISIEHANECNVPTVCDDQLIQIHSSERYYGIGYARGCFPRIFMMAKWIRHNLPGCILFYGGDCDDAINHRWEDQEAKLLNYYLEKGHTEYRINRDILGKNSVPPECDFDNKEMIANSWCGGAVGYSCPACGQKKVVKGGVTKIIERHQDYFD